MVHFVHFKRRQTDRPACKCSHEQITHYTKEGNCIVPGCGCLMFRSSGRQEFTTARRAHCELGHSHDSGLEIKECWDLTIQKKSGTIKDFSFHPLVELLGPSGHVISTYEVDFRVDHNDGSTEWVECKGQHLAKQGQWPLKWKLLMDMHHGDKTQKFRIRYA